MKHIFLRVTDAIVSGQHLTRRMTRTEADKVMYIYWTSVCDACPIKDQCTTSKERRVRRWEREAVLERVQDHLDRNPDACGYVGRQ